MTSSVSYKNSDKGEWYIGWRGLGAFLEKVSIELSLEVSIIYTQWRFGKDVLDRRRAWIKAWSGQRTNGVCEAGKKTSLGDEAGGPCHMPGTFKSPGICTCYFLCLEHTFLPCHLFTHLTRGYQLEGFFEKKKTLLTNIKLQGPSGALGGARWARSSEALCYISFKVNLYSTNIY